MLINFGTLHNIQLVNPWELHLFNYTLKLPTGYKSLLNV